MLKYFTQLLQKLYIVLIVVNVILYQSASTMGICSKIYYLQWLIKNCKNKLNIKTCVKSTLLLFLISPLKFQKQRELYKILHIFQEITHLIYFRLKSAYAILYKSQWGFI